MSEPHNQDGGLSADRNSPSEVGSAIQFRSVSLTVHESKPLDGESPDGGIGSGRFPLIVFSHGMGGSRKGYGYLQVTASAASLTAKLVAVDGEARSDYDTVTVDLATNTVR